MKFKIYLQLLHCYTFTFALHIEKSSYEFHGTIFNDGSEPLINSNITDSEVVNTLRNILKDYGQLISEDMEMSGSEYHQRVALVYPTSDQEILTNEIDQKDAYEKPSIETDRWAVYWDKEEESWYFYDKLSGTTTWEKPESLNHIQLREPRNPSVDKIYPDYIPRPVAPPPQFQHFYRRVEPLPQTPYSLKSNNFNAQDNDNSDGLLWNIWKNSFGSMFGKSGKADSKRKSRTALDSVGAPIIDSVGRVLTKSLVSFLTKEVTSYFNGNDAEISGEDNEEKEDD